MRKPPFRGVCINCALLITQEADVRRCTKSNNLFHGRNEIKFCRKFTFHFAQHKKLVARLMTNARVLFLLGARENFQPGRINYVCHGASHFLSPFLAIKLLFATTPRGDVEFVFVKMYFIPPRFATFAPVYF